MFNIGLLNSDLDIKNNEIWNTKNKHIGICKSCVFKISKMKILIKEIKFDDLKCF